jgi:hypothetical protein
MPPVGIEPTTFGLRDAYLQDICAKYGHLQPLVADWPRQRSEMRDLDAELIDRRGGMGLLAEYKRNNHQALRSRRARSRASSGEA